MKGETLAQALHTAPVPHNTVPTMLGVLPPRIEAARLRINGVDAETLSIDIVATKKGQPGRSPAHQRGEAFGAHSPRFPRAGA